MSSTMVIVLFFAGAREVVGEREAQLDLGADAVTVSELTRKIERRWPALGPYLRSTRVAVNGTYAKATDPVRAGDEVALIPPVAGG